MSNYYEQTLLKIAYFSITIGSRISSSYEFSYSPAPTVNLYYIKIWDFMGTSLKGIFNGVYAWGYVGNISDQIKNAWLLLIKDNSKSISYICNVNYSTLNSYTSEPSDYVKESLVHGWYHNASSSFMYDSSSKSIGYNYCVDGSGAYSPNIELHLFCLRY